MHFAISALLLGAATPSIFCAQGETAIVTMSLRPLGRHSDDVEPLAVSIPTASASFVQLAHGQEPVWISVLSPMEAYGASSIEIRDYQNSSESVTHAGTFQLGIDGGSVSFLYGPSTATPYSPSSRCPEANQQLLLRGFHYGSTIDEVELSVRVITTSDHRFSISSTQQAFPTVLPDSAMPDSVWMASRDYRSHVQNRTDAMVRWRYVNGSSTPIHPTFQEIERRDIGDNRIPYLFGTRDPFPLLWGAALVDDSGDYVGHVDGFDADGHLVGTCVTAYQDLFVRKDRTAENTDSAALAVWRPSPVHLPINVGVSPRLQALLHGTQISSDLLADWDKVFGKFFALDASAFVHQLLLADDPLKLAPDISLFDSLLLQVRFIRTADHLLDIVVRATLGAGSEVEVVGTASGTVRWKSNEGHGLVRRLAIIDRAEGVLLPTISLTIVDALNNLDIAMTRDIRQGIESPPSSERSASEGTRHRELGMKSSENGSYVQIEATIDGRSGVLLPRTEDGEIPSHLTLLASVVLPRRVDEFELRAFETGNWGRLLVRIDQHGELKIRCPEPTSIASVTPVSRHLRYGAESANQVKVSINDGVLTVGINGRQVAGGPCGPTKRTPEMLRWFTRGKGYVTPPSHTD